MMGITDEQIEKLKSKMSNDAHEQNKVVEFDEIILFQLGEDIPKIINNIITNNRQPFVFSTCSHDSEFEMMNGMLSMWRAYGNISIEFDKQIFATLWKNEKENFFYDFFSNEKTADVSYTTKDIFNFLKTTSVDEYGKIIRQETEIKDSLYDFLNIRTYELVRHAVEQTKPENFDPRDILAFIVGTILRKHEGFKEEREWRIAAIPSPNNQEWSPEHKEQANMKDDAKHKDVKFRDGKDGIQIPYIELFKGEIHSAIKSIMIGPHPERESRANKIRAFLNLKGLNHIKVKISDIPYVGMH
jgi:hypothetical protein